MIVWRIKRATFQIASIRYRAIFPAYFLKKYFQIDSLFLSGKTYPRHIPKNITALVIVKDFQALDLPLMQKTHACNGKIIYDQCDNIFSKEKKTIDKFTQTMSNVSHLLDAVVTPTNSLAESFRKNGHDKLAISVIPDIAITKSEEYDAIKALSKHTKTVRGIFRFPQYGWADRLPNSESPIQHTKENKLKKLVWFGTARSKYGRTGLDLLKEIIPDLNTVQTYCPFELVIVSNKPRNFSSVF